MQNFPLVALCGDGEVLKFRTFLILEFWIRKLNLCLFFYSWCGDYYAHYEMIIPPHGSSYTTLSVYLETVNHLLSLLLAASVAWNAGKLQAGI